MSNGGTLPQDLITDNILSRLPVKSLCRFKCVSPLWKSLISDPRFAKTHLNRTKTKNSNYPEQKIVFICNLGNLNSVDYNDVNPTFTKLEFPTVEQHDTKRWSKVLGSCVGLLLVYRHDKSIFLLNPSTRECKKLPVCLFVHKSNTYVHIVYGMGYDSSTDDYKVLMLSSSYENQGGTTTVAVYSLKTNAWSRRSEDFQDRSIVRCSDGVFLNGCLHFLSWNGNRSERNIIAVDLSGEIFKEIPLPTSLVTCESRHSDCYDLLVLGGSLCLVGLNKNKVCMMKEYGVRESWTEFTICSELFVLYWVSMLAEDEFLLFHAYGETNLVVYNPQKFTKRDIAICGLPTIKVRCGGTYVESLVSPFHVGGIGRKL